MPYIIAHCWYPSTKTMEVVKKYQEILEKYPFDESLGKQLLLASSSSKDGLENLVITEVKKQKLEDAFEREATVFTQFGDIEGFRYEIKIWSSVDEALKRLGIG